MMLDKRKRILIWVTFGICLAAESFLIASLATDFWVDAFPVKDVDEETDSSTPWSECLDILHTRFLISTVPQKGWEFTVTDVVLRARIACHRPTSASCINVFLPISHYDHI